MDTVTHNGRETAYALADRGGGGDPALFVHGSGGSHALWTAQRRLADRRPVASLDLSGHGDSEDVDADPGYTTRSAYADDVLAVAAETDAEIIAGSSLGGTVVLHVLLERDFDPKAAALVGTGARMGILEDLLEWLDRDFDRAVEFLHGPDRLFHDPDPELEERSRDVLAETGREVTRRDFLTCHEFDVRNRLGEVAVPTLSICGEYDQLTPPWYHEFLAEEIPDAEWVTVEECAHLPVLERPAAFNRELESFLETVDA